MCVSVGGGPGAEALAAKAMVPKSYRGIVEVLEARTSGAPRRALLRVTEPTQPLSTVRRVDAPLLPIYDSALQAARARLAARGACQKMGARAGQRPQPRSAAALRWPAGRRRCLAPAGGHCRGPRIAGLLGKSGRHKGGRDLSAPAFLDAKIQLLLANRISITL